MTLGYPGDSILATQLTDFIKDADDEGDVDGAQV
jgi:hypothetical protein